MNHLALKELREKFKVYIEQVYNQNTNDLLSQSNAETIFDNFVASEIAAREERLVKGLLHIPNYPGGMESGVRINLVDVLKLIKSHD